MTKKEDITISDTISIPKKWVPIITEILQKVVNDNPDADLIVSGLRRRLRGAPLVALPVLPEPAAVNPEDPSDG